MASIVYLQHGIYTCSITFEYGAVHYNVLLNLIPLTPHHAKYTPSLYC